MKVKVITVGMCTLLFFLLAGFSQTHKLSLRWSPQAMMYLKGKHGRRFVSDDVFGRLKPRTLHLSTSLRGIHSLQYQEFGKLRVLIPDVRGR